MKPLDMGSKGKLTLEAALIFPFVFLSFIALIFLCILIYQQTVLYSIAQSIAQKNGQITKEEILEYRKDGIDVFIKKEGNLFKKSMKIEVTTNYKLPLEDLLKVFGLKRNNVLKATLKVSQKDAISFIRNTDFGMEVLREIDGASGGKLSGFIEDMTEKVKKILPN